MSPEIGVATLSQEPLVLDKPVILSGRATVFSVSQLLNAAMTGETLAGDSGAALDVCACWHPVRTGS